MYIKDFKVLKRLGGDKHSTLHLTKRTADGVTYILREIFLGRLPQAARDKVLQEIRYLGGIQGSPGVPPFRESFIFDENKSVCIVLEHPPGGSLTDQITQKKSTGLLFTEPQIWRLLIDLSHALSLMHQSNFHYTTITATNIFIFNKTFRFGDRSLAQILNPEKSPITAFCPDLIKGPKSDIWFLGLLVLEMMSLLDTKFLVKNGQVWFDNIIGETVKLYGYSSDLRDVVGAMLNANSDFRPTAEGLGGLSSVRKWKN
jgi:serine/threonine protein kinase